MDPKTREELYEIKSILDDIESHKELYENTENYSIDGDKGPVTCSLIKYNLGPLDDLLRLWNNLGDSHRENRVPPSENRLYKDRYFAEEYKQVQKRIENSKNFLEEIYSLEKPLDRLKVENRYRMYP